jgi:uncharacterized protein (DUF302 family)
MNFEYTTPSARSFDAVVDDIGKLAGEKSFRVLHIHDVQATLAEKGFAREPLKIIEICNSKFAHEALKKDIGVSLFMPCKINVYLENGRTMIKAMRPAAIAEFYPGAGLEQLAAEVDKVIIEIVDKAASGK